MRSATASFFSLLATVALFFAISRLIYTQPTVTSRVIDRPQLTLLKDIKTKNDLNNDLDRTEPPQQETATSYPGIEKPQFSKSEIPTFKNNFSMDIPILGDNLSFNGPYLGNLAGNSTNNQALTPLIRIPPVYPRRAAAKGIEGWVKLGFTVLETGDVSDVKVLSAKPTRIFNRAAIKAISSWKFRPKIANGKPVQQHATQTITFKLSQ